MGFCLFIFKKLLAAKPQYIRNNSLYICHLTIQTNVFFP